MSRGKSSPSKTKAKRADKSAEKKSPRESAEEASAARARASSGAEGRAPSRSRGASDAAGAAADGEERIGDAEAPEVGVSAATDRSEPDRRASSDGESSRPPPGNRTGDRGVSAGGTAAATPKCPGRIKDFAAKPLSQYFIMDDPPASDGLSAVLSYLVPSNYDILCGSGQNYFHHIGNRRFRILIEMNVKRYESLLLASTDNAIAIADSDCIDNVRPLPTTNDDDDSAAADSIQKLVAETLVSVSECDPPGRFLGMDLATGRWRILNPTFARLKVERTYFECVRVTRRMEMGRAASEEETDGDVVEAQQPTRNASVSTIPPCQLRLGLGGMNPIEIASLQNQARVLLRGSTGQGPQRMADALQGNFHSQYQTAGGCLSGGASSKHGFYPREQLPQPPETRSGGARSRRSDSEDLMVAVVGGMLQLGKPQRRTSV